MKLLKISTKARPPSNAAAASFFYLPLSSTAAGDFPLPSQQHGLTAGQPGFEPQYDLNNDGKIDMADALHTARKAVKTP
ncbi:hypothetical protein [Paenibacillus mucilaginosus]|uniref:hypothetical protein n=1 Tax=Paenibacillus mucilaginosus TaxID=61624 RepID=UPI003D1EB779